METLILWGFFFAKEAVSELWPFRPQAHMNHTLAAIIYRAKTFISESGAVARELNSQHARIP